MSLVHDPKDVEVIAEIGVILLMFTIGVEFSISKLSSVRKKVFLFGSFQTFFTVGICANIGHLLLGVSLKTSAFFGFVVSLSSTAIVTKLLGDKGELNTRHGKMCVGILLLQDICVVIPLMLLTRVLSGQSGQPIGGYFCPSKVFFDTLSRFFLLEDSRLSLLTNS
jgi:CPA2 family monovalent cation:H+ antiporter-2